MQPYFFPYLGYFQLVQAVDTFVVYDDVNYIKGGWINRNLILADGKKQRITLPLRAASPNLKINQIEIDNRPNKLIETIRQRYSRAPEFHSVFPLIEDILLQKEQNLAGYLFYSLVKISDYLGIHPKWSESSMIKKDNELRGQDKIIAICGKLSATHYINTYGGVALYNYQSFANSAIKLSFIRSQPVSYPQFTREYVPDLSIIDVLMFNNLNQCQSLIGAYDLV